MISRKGWKKGDIIIVIDGFDNDPLVVMDTGGTPESQGVDNFAERCDFGCYLNGEGGRYEPYVVWDHSNFERKANEKERQVFEDYYKKTMLSEMLR